MARVDPHERTPTSAELEELGDDDPMLLLSDEPSWGSFAEERGYPDLDGAPYDQVVEELRARELM